MPAPDPSAPAPISGTGDGGLVPKEPWLKFPPDRKIWVGGISGLAAWLILGVLAHFGLDLQVIANGLAPLLGGQHIDVAGTIAGIVTVAVAHYTSPSIRDVVSRVNNAIVKIATAEPGNNTTAKVVSEEEAKQVAKIDAIAGAIPAETVQRMVDAGVVSSKVVGNKP